MGAVLGAVDISRSDALWEGKKERTYTERKKCSQTMNVYSAHFIDRIIRT